ncbi:MAG: lipid-binding SYLF domain-containing protein [Zoogloea sp.]|nr:lipid-binding SYLF domain-containing protein [Zoogloea sp.]
MNTRQQKIRRQALAALAATLASASHPVLAAQPAAAAPPAPGTERAVDLPDAVTYIEKAQGVVRQMEADPRVKALMQQSKGIYIVPNYGRAAVVVGGQGGGGVLVIHRDGKWIGPSFYNFASLGIGAQAGVSTGEIAMLLMNDKALNGFASDNKFSLDANAGITIVNYSAQTQGSLGKGDVILWSSTKGAFAGAAIAISDIHFDQRITAALYNRSVTAPDVINGRLSSPPQARNLLQSMPTARMADTR